MRIQERQNPTARADTCYRRTHVKHRVRVAFICSRPFPLARATSTAFASRVRCVRRCTLCFCSIRHSSISSMTTRSEGCAAPRSLCSVACVCAARSCALLASDALDVPCAM
eukprot:4111291-Pleurochrysis_carterae.AAC.4